MQTLGSFLETSLYLQGSPRYLFGVPGGAINGFYKAVKDTGRIQSILCAHETGAAFSAYGYARATRSLGLCATTSGPGATNALTGVAAAQMDSVPLALLSAQAMLNGRNASQDSSQLGIDTVKSFSGATKLSIDVSDPMQAPAYIDRAMREALSGRPGAVHISFNGAAPFFPLPQPVSAQSVLASSYVDKKAIEKAAKFLSKIEKIVIIAGHGIETSNAFKALKKFAEKHAIPVANTPKGRNFSESHPLSLGVFGMGGHIRAEKFVDNAEAILVVGSGLGETVTALKPLTPSKGIVQIDIDPNVIGLTSPVNIGIVGDAAASLNALNKALQTYPKQRKRKQVEQKISRTKLMMSLPDNAGSMSPMHPGKVVKIINDYMPKNTALVPDIGNIMGHATHYWSAEPKSYYLAFGLASMACAISIATGVRLGKPNKPVVAILGDGAFAMNPGGLHVQSEYNIKVINIVINDSGHGMVDHFDQFFFKGSVSPARFINAVDCAAIAEGFGVKGFRANSPDSFKRALKKACNHNGPSLIDVAISNKVYAPISPRFMPPARNKAANENPQSQEQKINKPNHVNGAEQQQSC